MVGMIFVGLMATIPALLVWFGLGLLRSRKRIWRCIGSSLTGGLIVAGLLMWDDAQQGFCCREYKATAFTELWMYIPMAVLFALVALPVVTSVDWGTKLFFNRKTGVDEGAEVFE